MPSFKNKKSSDAKKAKRAALITKILDDSQELTAQLKKHTDLKNTLKNQIEQMQHDEEMINKLRPKSQNDLRSLDMGSKQLEKDQRSLEKTFSKLTTKIDPQSYTKYTMPIIRPNRLLFFI